MTRFPPAQQLVICIIIASGYIVVVALLSAIGIYVSHRSFNEVLHSYCTPTALLLHSYCTPTVLLLPSYCAPTALLLYS
jgi:hypothetical protein